MAKHYVNNKELYAIMQEYIAKVKQAEEERWNQPPQVPNYVGRCLIQIANRLATKPNFSGYTYKEEMISDGIENALMSINNFNPEKSKNPFAYFTQIIYFAFIRRIQKEKKQTYIKHKAFEKSVVFNEMVITQGGEHHDHTSDTSFAQEFRGEFIQSYEKSLKERREKTKRAKQEKDNDTT
jgi:DNA-directed RNA polymerase specialized sigma24 family protein